MLVRNLVGIEEKEADKIIAKRAEKTLTMRDLVMASDLPAKTWSTWITDELVLPLEIDQPRKPKSRAGSRSSSSEKEFDKEAWKA